jgi:hypothetical protein
MRFNARSSCEVTLSYRDFRIQDFSARKMGPVIHCQTIAQESCVPNEHLTPSLRRSCSKQLFQILLN